jgi:predicted MFS family arabinose efflux permease
MNAKPIHERLLLLVLAAIQFTTIVDFLIIMPLGPQYMRVFHLTPGQFGLIVSAYAVSAGISGFVAGCVLDRFDRKWALLGLYSMFCLGTLFCATAPSYPMLVAARAIAGAFGGICSAMVMTIIGDVIPYERRGRAMGLVMSAFSVASIAGVPIGLVLATHFGWHVPFFALTALSAGSSPRRCARCRTCASTCSTRPSNTPCCACSPCSGTWITAWRSC